MLAMSAAPWMLSTKVFASSSCDDHVVRFGGILSPDTMNPFASWASWQPLVCTYDFLVCVDAQRHPDRRGFAKEWSVADDNLTWTFKIWPGMKWSDGQPATARDAAFTYNYLLGSIGKPDELNVGENSTADMQKVESITAIDDETLRIVTKTPTRWPIDNFTMIVPQHIWKDVSYADARSTFRNDPPLVGTGPLIVQEFQQGQFVRFTPNPHFRSGRPSTAGMIMSFFNTADPIAQGLKSGSLDFGISLTAAQSADLSKNPAIKVVETRCEQVNYLAFNTASGKGAGSSKALQDPAFRDAIGYAIDQKAIVDRAFRGLAEPGVGLVPPSAADYYSDLNDVRRHFDLAEAGRRLDDAGYLDSNGDGIREDKDGKRFQLELITGTVSGKLEIPMAAVQLIAGWLGQIGIPVSVTQLEAGALSARTETSADSGGWDLLVAAAWPSPTPDDLLRGFSSGAHANRAFWSNEKFDAILSEVEVTLDLKKGQELVDQAARLVYTEAPYITLCYPFLLEAYRKDCFEGWGEDISLWSYYPFDRLRSA
ncbi:MAG: ABC transporter substrate-binding protein [Mesorhizobium sp.]|nr:MULTISPECIES: ABC transporter substrate-binding protein [unclassified Mesorhizobium]TGP98913.1 ABC transporter substrate-binding protein [Mesorhizobium sp. M8A.F.Ca.ET.218.01.1.1]TGS41982.1 ABC transporter substrate-binding protein [Mesorhizobium sp. M8A.F.Ca.ET.182.01.1.1]TGS79662.1 ABC transporter substrate-binding protein [Mesorhizobium sp. M8A.F.Ca.ET.181.01.1.1]TGU88466.1 ABC transporter substrate-binding protein [Mesorhizobium sp. M00.F.Ca.ET.151.01.1.1]TGV56309.1 ABC transporter subs